MTKPIIYLTKKFREEFIDQINQIAPQYEIKTAISDRDLEKVEILVGWDKQHPDFFLSKKNHLKWIQTISAGIDYLPIKQLAEHEILVSNASGVHTIAISEHIIGILLAYYRGLIPSIRAQEKVRWIQQELAYGQLAGKNMLIVGTGSIGQKLAASIKSLGVQAFGINTNGHSVEYFKETYSIKNMTKIVKEMDIVVNILPLTNQTRHIYNSEFFASMKNSGVFINVGRGPSVKTADLVNALERNVIRFAALDVFEEEPLPADSNLWTVENLLITPHISGLSTDFQKKFMAIFLPNLTTFILKQQLFHNEVSLIKGY